MSNVPTRKKLKQRKSCWGLEHLKTESELHEETDERPQSGQLGVIPQNKTLWLETGYICSGGQMRWL